MSELLDAISAWQAAKAVYDKAAESCEYDRDYFLHGEADEVTVAADRVEWELNDLVDTRVKNLLNGLQLQVESIGVVPLADRED